LSGFLEVPLLFVRFLKQAFYKGRRKLLVRNFVSDGNFVDEGL
jgi:hypothetical protein